MKMIYCQECHDIVNLARDCPRQCLCRKSGGKYTDNLNAEYYGPAIPLGINNSSFMRAVAQQPKRGDGKDFIAFVIPEECPTMVKK